jgi:hypothetical protein
LDGCAGAECLHKFEKASENIKKAWKSTSTGIGIKALFSKCSHAPPCLISYHSSYYFMATGQGGELQQDGSVKWKARSHSRIPLRGEKSRGCSKMHPRGESSRFQQDIPNNQWYNNNASVYYCKPNV